MLRAPTVVALGVLAARAAQAGNECAADVKQFCAAVQPGGGRTLSCLQQNAANLSPACSARIAAVEARMRSRVEEFGIACRTDAGRLCSEVKPGGGRVLVCLMRNQDHLSNSCEAEMERIQEARDQVVAVQEACKADVQRLCEQVAGEAGLLVDCLQEQRANISETCRSIDPGTVTSAAEFVDAIEAGTSKELFQESLEILQGIDTIAFSRSQVLVQLDTYEEFAAQGNAIRMLFNPQFVFGHRSQFAFQVKAPLLAIYPSTAGASTQAGLGDVRTALSWAFAGGGHVHNYLSLALQWKTAVQPALGGTWALTPSYGVAAGITRWLVLSAQVAWSRSFAEDGGAELNILLVEPVVVLNLPGRSFFALDTRLGWDLAGGSFVPLTKGVIGLFIDRQKSLSITAWYQHALSTAAIAQSFRWAAGSGIAYYFDW